MPKKPNALPLPFLRVSRATGIPLEDQVYRLLRDAIRRGVLKGGLKLPSSRELAAQAGVARNTVTSAYQRLTIEGFVHSLSGSGTYVSTRFIEEPQFVRQSLRTSRWARAAAARSHAIRTGHGHDELFPWKLWRELVGSAWKRAQYERPDDADTTGVVMLREAIAEHVAVLRGIVCSADDVVITTGAAEAVSAAARLMTDPGDRVLLDSHDEPFEALFQSYGLTCIEGSIDGDGLEIDESVVPPPKLAFLRPACEGAFAVQMTAGRRHIVMEWAKTHGTAIIEYDFDAIADPGWESTPAIKAIDSRGLVTFVGAFDSTLLPPVRISFAIMPRAISRAFAEVDVFRSLVPSRADQIALALFIQRGHFARHVRRLRSAYDERRQMLLQELRLELSGAVVSIAPRLPLQISMTLAAGTAEDVAAAAAARGVDVIPLSLPETAEQTLVLSYGGLAAREVADVASRLAAAIEEVVESAKRPEAAAWN